MNINFSSVFIKVFLQVILTTLHFSIKKMENRRCWAPPIHSESFNQSKMKKEKKLNRKNKSELMSPKKFYQSIKIMLIGIFTMIWSFSHHEWKKKIQIQTILYKAFTVSSRSWYPQHESILIEMLQKTGERFFHIFSPFEIRSSQVKRHNYRNFWWKTIIWKGRKVLLR